MNFNARPAAGGSFRSSENLSLENIDFGTWGYRWDESWPEDALADLPVSSPGKLKL
jgi:hypothetical protein